MTHHEQNSTGGGARWLLGGAVTLAALAGLIWTGIVFWAEYRFRTISAPSKETSDQAFLIDYTGRLQHLLQLDPTNGEIRNQYASALALLGDSEKKTHNQAKAIADYKLAAQNLRRATRTQNTQTSRYFLADMDEKMGDPARADLMLREGLLLSPTDYLFNAAHLRLLNKRLLDMKAAKGRGVTIEPKVYDEARREFMQAATDWFIRAPLDMNSYFFMGNAYIDPLYPLQAYRVYLMGLSRPHWMYLNQAPLIEIKGVLGTIHQIIEGRYAKPYRDLRW